MNEKISLIVPAKNEVESLNAVLSEIAGNEIIDEILIVVDSEDDNSVPIAEKYKCKIIVQKKNL